MICGSHGLPVTQPAGSTGETVSTCPLSASERPPPVPLRMPTRFERSASSATRLTVSPAARYDSSSRSLTFVSPPITSSCTTPGSVGLRESMRTIACVSAIVSDANSSIRRTTAASMSFTFCPLRSLRDDSKPRRSQMEGRVSAVCPGYAGSMPSRITKSNAAMSLRSATAVW